MKFILFIFFSLAYSESFLVPNASGYQDGRDGLLFMLDAFPQLKQHGWDSNLANVCEWEGVGCG